MNQHKKRLTPEEKQGILREVEAHKANGMKTKAACKEVGITDATYYNWRSDSIKKPVSNAREIVHRNGNEERQLRIENQRLKMIVAEQALDIQALKEWRAR